MADFFGGSVTSKSPFRAVAVWAKTSLLIHSMVSPALAEAPAGLISRFATTIWIVAARTGVVIAQQMSAATMRRTHPGSMADSLLQAGSDMLGMLLVALKN